MSEPETTKAIKHFALMVLCSLAFSLSVPLSSLAQDENAPPPSRTVTKEEKDRLAQQSDIKSRTKLALEMMNNRIAAAEQFNSRSDFEAAFRELGGFQGLLDDTLNFLLAKADDSGKSLDNFKRLEIGIRAFSPRIEAIRRDLPPQYEDYVRTLLKCVRDARSKAIEPLFDDSVVKQKSGSSQ
jgi:hypothetical protein